MPFVQELTIRGTAVPLVGNAHIKLRVHVDPDPFVGTEYLRHGAAVRIRDVVTTAENYQALAVKEELLYDRLLRVAETIDACP